MSASNQLAAFNYAVQPLNNLQIKNITAAYTVSPSDNNFILSCAGATAFTIAMPSAASLPSGFNCVIWNNTTTAAMTVTIDPNGAETIDGKTTLILRRGEGMQIVCDGTNWQTGNKKIMRAYAENINVAQSRPTASGDLDVAIGAGASATGGSGIALGFDANTTSASGTSIGANSGANGSRVATGSGAMALGGSYASGADSFATAGANNTSTYGSQGANSIAIGRTCTASAQYGVAIGYNCIASNTYGVALGYQATASGTTSFAAGASSSYSERATASNSGSVALGGAYAAGIDSVAIGATAYALETGKIAFSNKKFSTNGDSQNGLLILRKATTNATATVLTTDNAAASSTNQVILPNNSAFAFTGTIIARQQAAGGTASAAWKVEGLIRREANAGTTTLVASTVTDISNVPAWTLALTADTTNGGLAVTATGAAATNIRWVATIQTSEVTYA